LLQDLGKKKKKKQIFYFFFYKNQKKKRRLGWKAKPHPLDNQIIIIFFVGGITCNEIREVKEFSKSKGRILISGTNITSPDIIFRKFWE
jgi:hypothetical protein